MEENEDNISGRPFSPVIFSPASDDKSPFVCRSWWHKRILGTRWHKRNLTQKETVLWTVSLSHGFHCLILETQGRQKNVYSVWFRIEKGAEWWVNRVTASSINSRRERAEQEVAIGAHFGIRECRKKVSKWEQFSPPPSSYLLEKFCKLLLTFYSARNSSSIRAFGRKSWICSVSGRVKKFQHLLNSLRIQKDIFFSPIMRRRITDIERWLLNDSIFTEGIKIRWQFLPISFEFRF